LKRKLGDNGGMAKKKQKSQMDFLLEYFKKNPNRDIHHPEIVDWKNQEKKGIQTNAENSVLKGVYSNAMQVSHTKEEFVVDAYVMYRRNNVH